MRRLAKAFPAAKIVPVPPIPVSLRFIDRRSSSLRGFTLIELLTVLAIVGILLAILLPVVGRMKEAARLTHDIGSMRDIGVAMLQYASDDKGVINNWGYEGGRPFPSALANSFWGRMWPYLKGAQLLQMDAATTAAVANDYLSATIRENRPDLIANADGINYTIATNSFLFTKAVSPSIYNTYMRLQNIRRPALVPYATLGEWGFWALSPAPLPSKQPGEGIYWAYGGLRTVIIYLDGHTVADSTSITQSQLSNLIYN